MRHNLPGGSMVQCVQKNATPRRLQDGASLFSFRCCNPF
ncbi:pyrBI operon leader peptide [Buttiauxella warmboldiae]|uniref:PyrBI operon leader peptide n=1 Tax=Buttiauxella warmboldiae TaxID=82993 RepID=A0A3N5EF62_9ENTR|nr:pyrBI operon leader peptide [Buttiauxella warmboldiae]